MLDIEGMNLVFFHLLAVIAGLGGSFFMVFILTPIAKKNFTEEQFHKLIAKIIRTFHPFLLTCYLILIITGAWIITRYKIDAGVNYFTEYGSLLMIKLSLVFVAVIISCYQFFGLGMGIVYMVDEAYEESDKMVLQTKIKRLSIASLVNLGILIAVVYLGLVIGKV